MATERELDILARETLYMEKEGVPRKMAVMSVLRSHKDIVWCDGIMKDIGVKISEIRKTKRQKEASIPKSTKPFATFAEKSFKDD